MPGVLTAEYGPRVGHDLLDERVANPSTNRLAAVLLDDLGDRPRADQVVDHGLTGILFEKALGHERGGERAGDDLRLLTDQEHAVGVAVEGDAELAALFHH